MKQNYYISIKERLNGDHLVHRQDCPFLSERKDMILLGSFMSVSEALIRGMSRFRKVGRCPFCSGYHTSNASCLAGQKDNEKLTLSAVRKQSDYDYMVYCIN